MAITPGAMSQQIKRLEKRLQVKLFHRNSRQVCLTDAGQNLLQEIAPLLQQITQSQIRLKKYADNPQGVLKLTAPIVAAQFLVDLMVTPFRSIHPEIKLELHLSDVFVDIIQAGFDAGIRMGRSVEQDMTAIPLTNKCRLSIVASPEYWKIHGIPKKPEELLNHQCLLYRPNINKEIQPWVFKCADRSFKVKVSGALVCNHYSMTLEAARKSLGVAYVLPDWLIKQDLQEGRLVSVLHDFCGHFPAVYLFYPGRELNKPQLSSLINFLKSRTPLLE